MPTSNILQISIIIFTIKTKEITKSFVSTYVYSYLHTLDSHTLQQF